MGEGREGAVLPSHLGIHSLHAISKKTARNGVVLQTEEEKLKCNVGDEATSLPE